MKFRSAKLTVILLTCLSYTSVSAQQAPSNDLTDWEGLHMVNYVQIEDLPRLQSLGVNAVMMEVDPNLESWRESYRAVGKHNMRLVPVLWGKHQSIWKWNDANEEWELETAKYPKSKGAKFIEFLRGNSDARKHTLGVYSFHEPWYIEERGKRKGTVRPERQQKFWKQIRELFDGEMKVYGEEVTWVPECKNGCVDYDYVTLYSFAHRKGEIGYRPGGRFQVGETGIDGSQAPFQTDKATAQRVEREQIALMHQMIQNAPPASDGTRTKLIALMGVFAHDEEPDLWNRMPTVDEMEQWARDVIRPSKNRLAGMGWYAFRNPTDYYKQVLFTDRTDPHGKDRWQAIHRAHQIVADEAQ